MWTRVQLKEKAKQALNNNYWKVVLVSLIVALVGGGVAGTMSNTLQFNSESTLDGSTDIYGDSLFGDSFYYEERFESGIGEDDTYDDGTGYSEQYEDPNASDEYWEGYYDGYFGNSQSDDTKDYLDGFRDGTLDDTAENEFGESFDYGVPDDVFEEFGKFEGFDTAAIAGIVGVIVAIVILAVILGTAIGMAYNAFIFNPLLVGTNRFFFKSLNEKAEVKEVAYAFDNNYKNVAKILFIRDLKIFLWTLLFIIPGIVKSYEYYMMPYLLAENPNLTKEEAFRLSKQMMSGNKWSTFVLELSFIGWDLLSGMTLGIIGIFYVEPYKYLTYAALYEELSAINGYPARAAAAQQNIENPYMQYNYYTQQDQTSEYVQPEPGEFEESVSQSAQVEYEYTDVDASQEEESE